MATVHLSATPPPRRAPVIEAELDRLSAVFRDLVEQGHSVAVQYDISHFTDSRENFLEVADDFRALFVSALKMRPNIYTIDTWLNERGVWADCSTCKKLKIPCERQEGPMAIWCKGCVKKRFCSRQQNYRFRLMRRVFGIPRNQIKQYSEWLGLDQKSEPQEKKRGRARSVEAESDIDPIMTLVDRERGRIERDAERREREIEREEALQDALERASTAEEECDRLRDELTGVEAVLLRMRKRLKLESAENQILKVQLSHEIKRRMEREMSA